MDEQKRQPRQVFEVRATWEAFFCETREDAELCRDDLRKRLGIIGVSDRITLTEVTIYGDISEGEREYMRRLRKHYGKQGQPNAPR